MHGFLSVFTWVDWGGREARRSKEREKNTFLIVYPLVSTVTHHSFLTSPASQQLTGRELCLPCASPTALRLLPMRSDICHGSSLLWCVLLPPSPGSPLEHLLCMTRLTESALIRSKCEIFVLHRREACITVSSSIYRSALLTVTTQLRIARQLSPQASTTWPSLQHWQHPPGPPV